MTDRNSTNYQFAFLVHPRDFRDIYKKFPLLRILPEFLLEIVVKNMKPVVVSKITGLKSVVDNKDILGLVIGFPMTAAQMLRNRKKALKKILASVKLSEKYGVKIIGLGALISSLSRGGLDIIEHTNSNITTGHAYTTYNVFSHIQRAVDEFELNRSTLEVSVVGSSGSIGSSTALMLARNGYMKIKLLDLDRKKERSEEVMDAIRLIDNDIEVIFTSNLHHLKESDVIVTATNAPETLVKKEHLKSGAIVVNDAQPSDIADEVFEMPDVIVIEAGLVKTPGINSHFNFGFKENDVNFCCLAEIMILAANHWDEHYVINRPSTELIDHIAKIGEKLNFSLPRFQNFKEIISDVRISNIKSVLKINNVSN